MASRLLERAQVVPRPRGEEFAFFADAHNLEAITPQFLRFSVVTPAPIAWPGAPSSTTASRSLSCRWARRARSRTTSSSAVRWARIFDHRRERIAERFGQSHAVTLGAR